MELSDELIALVLQKVEKDNIGQIKQVCNRWDYITSPRYNHCDCDECMKCGRYSLFVAVSSDHINCVRYILKWFPYSNDLIGETQASIEDSLITVEEIAVSIECLKVLCEYTGGDFCYLSTNIGSLELLKWMKSQGYPIYKEYFLHSARLGLLDCLIWLHNNKIDTEGEKINEEYTTKITSPCFYAGKNGHIDCLEYLIAQGYTFNPNLCSEYGINIKTLKFAVENNYELYEDICVSFVMNGQLENLIYAHENGYDWDEETCEVAPRGGYNSLTILTYLHEHGCPWDYDCCVTAVETNNLECLMYALEHGCPWNNRILTVAKQYNNDCYNYALFFYRTI